MKDATTVSISRWLGPDPRTGTPETPRYSIVWRGTRLHTYETEQQALKKIRESGWRLVDEGDL